MISRPRTRSCSVLRVVVIAEETSVSVIAGVKNVIKDGERNGSKGLGFAVEKGEMRLDEVLLVAPPGSEPFAAAVADNHISTTFHHPKRRNCPLAATQ